MTALHLWSLVVVTVGPGCPWWSVVMVVLVPSVDFFTSLIPCRVNEFLFG